MNNIRNLNIWKTKEPEHNLSGLGSMDISELNLSVRSFNCLKRAGCNTVGDILERMEEEGNGLRKIRNLGTRSENEIRETVDALKESYVQRPPRSEDGPVRKLAKPAKSLMGCRVEEFDLSWKTLNSLRSSGVFLVKDLYRDDLKQEPGWYAVRELFEKIPWR